MSPRRSLGIFKEKMECPETSIEQQFNTQKFLGRWYEMYRPKRQPFQRGDCNFASYSLKDDGQLRVINSQRFVKMPNWNPPMPQPDIVNGFVPKPMPKPPINKNAMSESDKIKMIMNNEKKNQKLQDYLYNERFGDINWKFMDKQGNLFQYIQAEGMARKTEPEAEDGRFQLKFSKFQPVWGNYHVLETDYDSYAIVYSCRTFLFGKKKNEYVWVLTREPMDPKSTESEFKRIRGIAKDVLKKNVPDYDFDGQLRRTMQREENDCIYPNLATA